ncbi:hypothetical protein IC614_02880 [Allosphingosinicella flava]|uniref:Uncharacterized protein n=1 Tax=Allosphingosinicella flava TaxID=2771430 RepID=A0A7T2GL70_9SPHN|nr:hypothetical protein IC614_02880 [Sphingosinicella flava]
MSETILTVMSVITALLLFVCPGWFFLFLLPAWLGWPLALGSAAVGPWMLYRIDRDLYGERK